MKATNLAIRISPRVLFRGAFYLGGDPPLEPLDPSSPDGRSKILNQPSAVRIRVLDRRTMVQVADLWSAADGTWRLNNLDDREYLVLGLDERGLVNGAIQDRVRPAPMGGT